MTWLGSFLWNQEPSPAKAQLRNRQRGGKGDAAGSHLLTGNSGSLLVLYATATGTTELLANRLAAEIRSTGIAADVRDMAHCQPDVLKRTNCVLMVVSTYGTGEPPEGAAIFYGALVNGTGLDLSGLRFSVLALGNTTFDHFCRCGKELDFCAGTPRGHPHLPARGL